MRNLRRYLLILLLPLLAACAGSMLPHKSLPEGKASEAQVIGYSSNIRAWGDEAPKDIDRVVAKRIEEYSRSQTDYFKKNKKYPTMDYLALSGGANDGAFGAGVLYGWSAAGIRPQFNIVTGVSTGALIAPFAFLGSDYDDELKEAYTTMSSEKVVTGSFMTFMQGITGGLAVADNSPLAKKIKDVITQDMLDRIGEEHRKGRRLLMGTTNIEAQRSVIWDIGAIANSGNPDRLKLFHTIMLASSAVPGVVKPIFIDVTVDGQEYNEIHADGGVTTQLFLYPLQTIKGESAQFKKHGIARRLYIIRNNKAGPEYEPVVPGLFTITGRALLTLTKYNGLGDLYRLYLGATRDGIDYNLVQIPQDFKEESQELFDPKYMAKLFDVGYQMGKGGVPWEKAPPGVIYMDEAKAVAATAKQKADKKRRAYD